MNEFNLLRAARELRSLNWPYSRVFCALAGLCESYDVRTHKWRGKLLEQRSLIRRGGIGRRAWGYLLEIQDGSWTQCEMCSPNMGYHGPDDFMGAMYDGADCGVLAGFHENVLFASDDWYGRYCGVEFYPCEEPEFPSPVNIWGGVADDGTLWRVRRVEFDIELSEKVMDLLMKYPTARITWDYCD